MACKIVDRLTNIFNPLSFALQYFMRANLILQLGWKPSEGRDYVLSYFCKPHSNRHSADLTVSACPVLTGWLRRKKRLESSHD